MEECVTLFFTKYTVTIHYSKTVFIYLMIIYLYTALHSHLYRANCIKVTNRYKIKNCYASLVCYTFPVQALTYL